MVGHEKTIYINYLLEIILRHTTHLQPWDPEGLDKKGFPARLALAIETAGGSTYVAKTCGVSTSVLSKWRLGQSEPTLSHLVGLAQVCGVDLAWLATGAGAAKPEQAAWFGNKGANQDEYAAIPAYDSEADIALFRKTWIQQELRGEPGDLCLVIVGDATMAPTLQPGDLTMIDRRDAAAAQDGLYALKIDGHARIKRLQRRPGRVIVVTSDNPAYEAYELPPDAPGENLAIIGRVVWYGRRLR